MNDIIVSVIIPGKEITEEIKNTIEILKTSQIKNEIIFVSNSKNQIFIPNVKVIYTEDLNISKKRNIGVAQSSGSYIAFIDSDAFPEKNWLHNAIKLLKNNASIGLVTGPDTVDLQLPFMKKIIGFSHNSIILTGQNYFRKNINISKYVNNAFSCNMILSKDLYLQLDGMDENIYIGEDLNFSNKVTLNHKIFFSEDIIVYHTPRDIISFMLQRFSYGYDIVKMFKEISFISKICYLIPLLVFITLVICSFVELNLILYFILILLTVTFLLESIRISQSIFFIPIYFLIIFIGTMSFALGFLIGIFKLRLNIKKIYTYRL